MDEPTKGPWHTGGTFCTEPGETRQWVWGPTPEGSASGVVVAKDMRPADARLVAASWELLEALYWADEHLSQIVGPDEEPRRKLRAAIAKATGGAE